MVGEDKILARLQRLEQALLKLDRIHAKGWDAFYSDTDLQDIVDRNLQVAIWCCVDVANHLIAAQALRFPTSGADAFRVLTEEMHLPSDLAMRLAEATGLRNVIVHEYLDIDLKLEFEVLSQLDDLRRFAEWVARAL